MNNFNFGEDLKIRTKQFAIKTISLTKKINNSLENQVFVKQLIRSSTSVASNYRAACKGRSKAEFYSKLSIVIEEMDESLFWLEMIEEFNPFELINLKNVYKEGEQLMKIFSKSRKTMNDKKNQNIKSTLDERIII